MTPNQRSIPLKKLILAAAATATLVATGAAPAQAAADQNPKATCAWLAENAPDQYEFVATKRGACESTVARYGIDHVLAFGFPSNAAAVGNCKTLEKTTFQAYTPEDGRAYPYQFYWDIRILLGGLADAGVPGAADAAAYYDSVASQLYAANRAGCVRVLRRVHDGLMGPVFGFLGSLEGGEE